MIKLNTNQKLTIQVILSVFLIITGLALLFMGFFAPPHGEIDNSVLVAYGEISTFAGSLLGLDYHYKYKTDELDTEIRERRKRSMEEEKED